MGNYFGTDGVRGVANIELTPELVYKLGRAGAYVLTKHTNHTAKIITHYSFPPKEYKSFYIITPIPKKHNPFNCKENSAKT